MNWQTAALWLLAGFGVWNVAAHIGYWARLSVLHVGEKLSSSKRWRDAYRQAVTDLADECNRHRVSQNLCDQLRAENRALRAQLAGLPPITQAEPVPPSMRLHCDVAALTPEDNAEMYAALIAGVPSGEPS